MANKAKDMEGYVGFANLPNQVYRRSVKRGFDFTLMVVGESGLGKSTLINSLFLTDIYSSEFPGPSQRVKKTVNVETSQVTAKENGVQLRLTIVDTPGFGDQVDNSNCWQPILDHIDNKFEEYLNAEARVNRRTIPDKRVHCCLYFIAPSGHGLKPLDVEFMKRLHDKVNIIPLIAKADTMTPEECRDFKKRIMQEIDENKIKIYEFPDVEEEEDTKENKKHPMETNLNPEVGTSVNTVLHPHQRRNGPKDKEHNPNSLKERVPFAVVGSNMILEVSGKRVRGRQYPWGVAEVENLEHCDFIPLRNMLIRTHMQDLKDVTNNVHYENYRCRKLTAVTAGDGKKAANAMAGEQRVAAKNPLAQFEDEKQEHEMKMKKMENEMEQVFEMKVKEKKKKLEDSEKELHHRLEQMNKSLDQQRRDLEDKRRQFEKERQIFEENQRIRLESSKTLDPKKSKKGKTIF